MMPQNALDKTTITALESKFCGGIGSRILHFRRTSSTMDVAHQMLNDAEDVRSLHGVVVLADEQTKGRGRFERSWDSRAGEDILASMILCPRLAISGQMTTMASLAAALTVDETTSSRSVVKWPNDVLVGGKKICGVIAESLTVGDAFASIVGIGLNVNWVNDPGRPTDYSATSIREISDSNESIDRSEILAVLLGHINDLYDAIDSGESIMDEWRGKLDTLGSRVEVAMASRDGEGEVISGLAEDVDEFGRLLIREAGGVLRAVAAGEVTTRRHSDGS